MCHDGEEAGRFSRPCHLRFIEIEAFYNVCCWIDADFKVVMILSEHNFIVRCSVLLQFFQ